MFLEECKCVVKVKMMSKYITDDIYIFSGSDEGNSDDENSDEKNSNEENSDEKK